MRGELPSQEQTTCSGNSRCSSVCLLARMEWNNRGQPETPARRSSRVISERRLAFFQPIAVLAAARYCGAATTYSLLSPKISKASSRIGRSSGKIGQLRMQRLRDARPRFRSSPELSSQKLWRTPTRCLLREQIHGEDRWQRFVGRKGR
jgi:hypothetical protein